MKYLVVALIPAQDPEDIDPRITCLLLDSVLIKINKQPFNYIRDPVHYSVVFFDSIIKAWSYTLMHRLLAGTNISPLSVKHLQFFAA